MVSEGRAALSDPRQKSTASVAAPSWAETIKSPRMK
jgi:hypothetical protein